MNGTIPKRIIQVDTRRNLPTVLRGAMSSVRLNNADFEYVFFDGPGIDSFIDSFFPEYRKVFQAFPLPVQRYDFFRYLAVYKLGGFYLDTDMVLASSLEELLGCACVFPFERLTWSDYLRDACGMDWEVGNWAFGASADHPFIRAVVQNCIRAQTDRRWAELPMNGLPALLREELCAIYTTGPGLVSRTLAEYPDAARDVTVLFPPDVTDKQNCWNQFGTYGAHLGGGAWRARRGAWRTRLLNFLGRRNERRAIKLAQKLGATRSLDIRQHRAIGPPCSLPSLFGYGRQAGGRRGT